MLLAAEHANGSGRDDTQHERSTDDAQHAVMDPAVRLQLLQQLAEQSRAAAIATLQTKAAIMAALLVLALTELWLGLARWRAGPRCSQSYQLWLVCDGAATCVGTLLGLAALLKGVQVARGVETEQWVLPDGEVRDARGDLTGAFWAARCLSDGVDMALVLLFALGWYAYYARGGGGGCDDTLRSWVWWGLVMKLLAPIGVSLAGKCLVGGPPDPSTPQGSGFKKIQ